MHYSQLGGLTDAVASPLVLHATSLLQTQLRVSSTVLRSSQAGGTAVYVGGGVDLLSSAVVLDGVLLEASGGLTAFAMNVTSSSRLSLRNHSVFSVKNVSVVSSGGGIVLGERLAVSNSVLRFVSVEGSVASPLVRCDTCGAQPRDEPVQRLLHGQLRCQFADARDVRSCVGPACQRRLRVLHTEQLVECAEHRILQRRVCVWGRCGGWRQRAAVCVQRVPSRLCHADGNHADCDWWQLAGAPRQRVPHRLRCARG
ncbi:dispersed gene family protein 1 (DGF-1), putative, partial [Trypanosoma cruzi]